MKSPFGWCVIAAGLLTSWTAVAVAQTGFTDDGSYQLSEPFSGPEPDAGFRVQADALLWTRSDSGSSAPVIGGPQTFALNGLSNNYVGGYRIGGAWLIDPNYEVEGVWTSFADWTASGGGVLSRAVAFNGGTASPLVDPSGNANFINRGTYFRPVFDAAMDPLANPAIQNYDFLKGGSTYSLYSTSKLYDVQANFKTRRSAGQWLSYGVGYRNIRLTEGTTAEVSGVFGTNDIPGGGFTHNTLANDALTAHGLSLISGAGNGWTNTPGSTTTLALLWNGTTTNQLNGLQGTVDAALFERGFFTLEGVLRGGLFYNRITGTVREVYAGGGADNSVYGRTFTDQKDAVSFAGNIGLNGLFRLNNNIQFRTGYELMFLTNTAESGKQQSGISYNSLGTASYSVQTGGSVVFHGLRAGVEVVW
jgi:hypothetical protein